MNKKRKGFTLVELIAVLCILATIMVLVIPKGDKSIENAKKIAIKAEARAIVNVASILKSEGHFKNRSLDYVKLSDIYNVLNTESKLKQYFETVPTRIDKDRLGYLEMFYYKQLATMDLKKIHISRDDGEKLEAVDDWDGEY